MNEILEFRKILSDLYRNPPLNDEGNICDMSTIFEVIRLYDEFFNI